MTYILILIIAVLLFLLIEQRRYRVRLMKVASRSVEGLLEENQNLYQTIGDKARECMALEEGNQELVDNYENDFLDMREKLEAAKNAAAYDREMRDEAEKKLEAWDTAIRNHADHCDSILEEVVDAMMEVLHPTKE